MDHCIYPAIIKLQAIASVNRDRLVREPRAVKRAEEPISAAVARKNAACTIAAVSRRREAYDKQPCPGVAHARHGSAPVLFVSESTDFFASHALAPFDESRTAETINNLFLDCFEKIAFRHSRSERY